MALPQRVCYRAQAQTVTLVNLVGGGRLANHRQNAKPRLPEAHSRSRLGRSARRLLAQGADLEALVQSATSKNLWLYPESITANIELAALGLPTRGSLSLSSPLAQVHSGLRTGSSETKKNRCHLRLRILALYKRITDATIGSIIRVLTLFQGGFSRDGSSFSPLRKAHIGRKECAQRFLH
jgi:hypothetical protein